MARSAPCASRLGGLSAERPNFSGKISIFRVKFLMTFFLVIDLVLQIFPFFFHIFRMFTMLNVVYDHSQFFTLFMLSRTSDNTRPTSQNIAWAVPPPQIFVGGTVPPVPLGLRPSSDGVVNSPNPASDTTPK